ncbi:hypothetical protein C1X64_13340 [Pseudomonas sp. GW456-E7]|nr:hypothetical protein C1X64_13340 [Pseudomonas sp. GW456-E7]
MEFPHSEILVNCTTVSDVPRISPARITILTFHNLLARLEIRAVDICRLLIIILREYRESGRMRPERFLPVEHF